MNTEKFTQGDYISDFGIVTEENIGIAQCFDNSVVNEEEAEANCHLIAAAPEMYRMLESVHNLLSGYLLYMPIRTSMERQQYEHKVKQIEKLLKKARGENE